MKPRENPLRRDRIEELLPFDPSWLDTSWDAILHRLASLDRRAAVVGPHGSGKSTFLDALAPRLRALGHHVHHHQLTQDHPFDARAACALSRAIRRRDFILLDSAGQLPPSHWHRLRRATARAAGLVVTAHRPAQLPLLLATSTSPLTLHRCLAHLFPDGQPPLTPAQIDGLYHRCRGNIREALWECYDLSSRS